MTTKARSRLFFLTAVTYLALVVALTGCWDLSKLLPKGGSLDNRSQYPDQFFLHVWAALEQVSQTDINLEGMTAIVYEDLGEFQDACLDVAGLGCSDPSNIHVLGSVGTNDVDVGTEVAHQLAHLHFWQTENGDGRHAHAEWFGEGGFVDQVRHLLVARAIQ